MFSEALQVGLDLTVNNEIFRIPGANVKDFEVKLYSYGFDASADFWIYSETSEDSFFPHFIEPDLIEARLSVIRVYNLPSPRPKPLIVKGLVTQKSFQETAFKDGTGNPVWFRRYTIHFQDAARVLWRQHFPTALYVDAKMADVVKAQVVRGISLTMDWEVLEQQRPLICLSLGDEWCDASFYDFLIWFVHSQNGVFTYDSQEASYRLSMLKDSLNPLVSLIPLEVAVFRVHSPEVLRHDIRIMNGYADLPKSEEIPQEYSVTGIRRHFLLRTPLAGAFDARKTLEAIRFQCEANRSREIELEFAEFPAKTLRPGVFATFDEAEWGENIFLQGELYRVIELHVCAAAENREPARDLNAASAAYQVEMSARLEEKENPYVHLPSFRRPRYPVRVEGKIVSESGANTDKTYQIYTDQDTSQDCYTVNVPLWNKDVRILFEPGFMPGHFYFPAFKHSRVLLEIYAEYAEIVRFLEWGSGSRLPMDGQGNHILFGKNSASETSLKHDYTNEKPVLNIKRISGEDTELIRMEEGTLILQTQEEEVVASMSETFSVTPEVEAARVQLVMENEAAMAGVTADFEATSTGINGAIRGAVDKADASLEAMDAEISAKADEIDERVQAAMQQLSKTTGELEGRVQASKAELKALITL